jgi:phage baseplate assembly protein W
MSGITPRLPLVIDGINGIKLIQNYKDLVKQNVKNLLLTIPGERVMDAEFGVGLKQYLFELDNESLRGRIRGRIGQQVQRYLPYIRLIDISFDSQGTNAEIDRNFLSVVVEYEIVPLSDVDNLELTLPVD